MDSSHLALDETTFTAIVDALSAARDKGGHPLRMDSVIISRGGTTKSHYFTDPSERNDVRSLSKPVLSMALGVALDRGLKLRGERTTVETLVWPFFEGRVSLTNRKNLARVSRVRLKHLLTHTIGHEVGLLFSKEVKDLGEDRLVEHVWNTDIAHEPGTHFVYSNAGPYLLSAIIQEELGVGLDEWVSRLIFGPLGIAEFTWKRYGRYCAGSSGLKLSNGDLHRLALLFAHGGYFRGTNVVPAHWLEEMARPHVRTPGMFDAARAFPKFAYGYGLWVCEDGRFYCDGTDGQYLIVLPRSGTVITTFGHQPDMKPIAECFRRLLPVVA